MKIEVSFFTGDDKIKNIKKLLTKEINDGILLKLSKKRAF